MSQCIYTGATEKTESFRNSEHIFPKCIGGIETLPKGWVCDRINNSFSSLERSLARDNPLVAITRMFLPPMGRKKHKNRNRIAILQNISEPNDYSLGYISNGTPYPICQLCITSETPLTDGAAVPVKIVVPPDEKMTFENQLQGFWKSLQSYDGRTHILKDSILPTNMLLLGQIDSEWYLGISDQQSEETAQQAIHKLIMKMSTIHLQKEITDSGQVGKTEHQVHARFTLEVNLDDIMRVYAKIAINCLAKLKGHEYAMEPAFDGVKHAILTGENIQNYVVMQDAPNTLKIILRQCGERSTLGSRFHSTMIFYNNGTLYAEITTFGGENTYLVILGQVSKLVSPDWYICDWENKEEYTLIDYVVQIRNHDENV